MPKRPSSWKTLWTLAGIGIIFTLHGSEARQLAKASKMLSVDFGKALLERKGLSEDGSSPGSHVRRARHIQEEAADEAKEGPASRAWPEIDYVSKRSAPEGYEKWIHFARENKCHMGSYTRIEKDLEGFVDAKNPGQLKISKSQIKAASSLASTTVFTVKDGAVSQQGDPGFANSFTNLMHRFVHLLPDMEFVVNMMDEPRVLPGNTDDVDIRMNSSVCQKASESFRKHRHLHGYINNRQTGPSYDPVKQILPLFSQSKINECFMDITYPTLYGNGALLPKEEEDVLIPWSERKSDLFWRGSTTGGAYTSSGAHRLSHRQRLVKLAKDKPNMDLQFTAIIQCYLHVCQEMEQEYGVAPRISGSENFRHKFLMSLDGNTFVSRLPQFLSSASLNFRAGIFSEWYDEWIQDGKHYLQVELDFSDLEERLNWAVEHDEESRRIGLEGRNFATQRLRTEDMECYLFRLLLEYAAIIEK